MKTNNNIEIGNAVFTQQAINTTKDWQEHDNNLLCNYIDDIQRAALYMMRHTDIKETEAVEAIEHVQNLSFIAESLRTFKKP
ncbi:MAG: hypothetical protein ACOYOV_11140 [Bacteroidales bacterium]